MQGKSSMPSSREGGTAQPSKIPRPSGGSQEQLRRVYRSRSLAQNLTTDRVSEQIENRGPRRHSFNFAHAALRSNPPSRAEVGSSSNEHENQYALATLPSSPHPRSASRASSSALPRPSDISDGSSGNEIYSMASESFLPHDASFGGLSSILADSEYSAEPVAEQTRASDDTNVAGFSPWHSPRQVHVNRTRQGTHERVESPEGAAEGEEGGVHVAPGAEEEIGHTATHVRTRSQGTMIRSPPPPPKKSWTAKVFACLSCGEGN